MKKVLFISSTGGHLTEMMCLKQLFANYDFRIITEETPSTSYLEKKYAGKVNYLFYGTKDHLLSYPWK